MVIYLVGAGPGDVGLLTLRAKKIIEEADCIVYDRLANPDILEFAKPNAKFIYVGKKGGYHIKTQKEINDILVNMARKYKKVVRLKGGDPFIFGRGGEEAEVLQKNKVRFEIVPGISSVYASLTYAGIPITHREYNSSFGVLTGHEAIQKLDWKKLPENLVIVMGIKNRGIIAKNLIDAGFSPKTPVAVIYKGTTFNQKVTKTTLSELKNIDAKPPSVIVVGKITEINLSWFSEKLSLLKEKKILITRKESEDTLILKHLGAKFFFHPLFSLKKIDFQIPNLENYDAIVFTSANGVGVVFEKTKLPKEKTYFSIGKKTSKKLEELGIKSHHPPSYNSKALGEFITRNFKGEKILILRSKKASPILKNILEPNFDVKEIHVYDVEEKKPDKSLFERMDIVFLTCPTAAKSFSKIDSKALIVSIGPETSKFIERKHIQAEKHTIEGMVEALIEYLWEVGE